MECITSALWLNQLSSKDNVLLVNPPIQEVRYAWAKWNQPTDLLLLSSKLKNEVNCSVELLDFMLPSEIGRVTMRDPKDKVVGSTVRTTYKSRIYGMTLEEATQRLTFVSPQWTPTHIVITTMTTYWFETLRPLIQKLKTIFPEVKVTIIGAYPVHETDHAMRMNADYLVTDYFAMSMYLPDFDVYSQTNTKSFHDGRNILFGGININLQQSPEKTIEQIKQLRKNNIRDFVLFEANIFQDKCKPLIEFLNALKKEDISINLHGLCGLNISDAVDGIYTKMQEAGYRSFFLEYDLQNHELNLDNYRRAYLEFKNSGNRIASGNLAGFIMIGTAEDELEKLFRHTFNILEICGSIIPKPFTPNIDTLEYQRISKQRLDLLSPHLFPLAVENGISRDEYREFYQHTSFLNEKRLGNSFDFFDNHYCSIALKRSLGKKG